MKKLILSLLIALGGFWAQSCSNPNSPEAVAKNFLTEVNNLNFENAKKYCDNNTAKILDLVSSMQDLSKAPKNGKNMQIEITKVQQNDSTATVFYKMKDLDNKENPESKETSIDLKKIDGNWKVALNKENGKENDFQDDDDSNDVDDESYLEDGVEEEEEIEIEPET